MNGEEERRRLLAAASFVLERTGWTDFKVSAVLRESGCGTRAFYRHFTSKEQLLFEVITRQLRQRTERFIEPIGLIELPVDRLVAWVELLLSTLDPTRDGDYFRFVSMHWPMFLTEFPDDANAVLDTMLRPLVRALEDGRAGGTLRCADPMKDARATWALVSGIVTDSLLLTHRNAADARAIVLPFVLRAFDTVMPRADPA